MAIVFFVGFASLAVRLAAAQDWAGAAGCIAVMAAPLLIGGLLWRRQRNAALEEARRVRTPKTFS